ncbi:hypothetical protein [Tomitella fengzijianii]|uniref:hypothetical protein n=1 Tax=Tomitella fengzijianii TaxID=2597660 RepID=UPI001E625EC2|nr:hypothetical protein [Tomitella fengzijianii]
MQTEVFVVDRVVTSPGKGRAFVGAYLAGYAPGARSRGMVLDRILVSPPIWRDDEGNTVTATWRLDGVSAWWDMTRAGRGDPALRNWWDGVAPMIAERSRSMAAAAADVDGLCDL